ncbi:uncharacterized protein DSM5745_07290 [Aspergillus mulundensis]|uniref:Uncharacterized protein n=1 Tax=Aspergillus mulundensis TaxID=1810919 RepID=A0A3D8RKZ6_9EURO|nr:hypothetical protein DSM5745_07290 [Aspergillus mulundensis]RDW74628.1 hypothetical protein DSM5745_07290 [Aspergillus mulundensis]
MPFLHNKTSSSTSSTSAPAPSSTQESKLSLRSLFNRKTRAPPGTQTHPRTASRTHQAAAATQQPNSRPSSHRTSSTSTASTYQPVPQADSTWEDIDPPAFSPTAPRTPTSPTFSHYSYQATQNTSRSTMDAHSVSPPPSSTSESILPSYNDVSGAVVVDSHGYPRFLTPQEEQERKAVLQQAVRERMMGLPRRTDFSWEASARPILPRYQPPAVASKD